MEHKKQVVSRDDTISDVLRSIETPDPDTLIEVPHRLGEAELEWFDDREPDITKKNI